MADEKGKGFLSRRFCFFYLPQRKAHQVHEANTLLPEKGLFVRKGIVWSSWCLWGQEDFIYFIFGLLRWFGPKTCQGVLKGQKYPQYCWEFHEQVWEALSGTTSEKRGVPSRTEGEIILEMLWRLQMPWNIGFGESQPHSGRSESVSGVSPEFFRDFFRKVPAVLGVCLKGQT